mgnify:CR=1 FL=1
MYPISVRLVPSDRKAGTKMKIEEKDTITAILKTEGITDMISCENAHILCDKYQLSHAAFGKCC